MKKIKMKLLVNAIVLIFVFFIGLIVAIITINNRINHLYSYMVGISEVGAQTVSFFGVKLITMIGSINPATQAYTIEIIKTDFYNGIPIFVGIVLVCVTLFLSFITKRVLKKTSVSTEVGDAHDG